MAQRDTGNVMGWNDIHLGLAPEGATVTIHEAQEH